MCVSWKLKCWILLMHGVTMKFTTGCFCPNQFKMYLIKKYFKESIWKINLLRGVHFSSFIIYIILSSYSPYQGDKLRMRILFQFILLFQGTGRLLPEIFLPENKCIFMYLTLRFQFLSRVIWLILHFQTSLRSLGCVYFTVVASHYICTWSYLGSCSIFYAGICVFRRAMCY